MTNSDSRVHCIVPFCRRTRRWRRDWGEEWICGKHWRAVPLSVKRRLRMLGRRYERDLGGEPHWKHPAGSPLRLRGVKIARIWDALWDRAKRIAIEAAGGIG